MLREIVQQLDRLPSKIFAGKLNIDVNAAQICVVTAHNSASLTHANLDVIATQVAKGIAVSGGNAHINNICSIDVSHFSGCNADKFDLPSREHIANSVELLASCEIFDAFVFVGGEPNTLAGMLIGAIRVNMPSIFVSAGIMSPFVDNEEHYGLFELYCKIGAVKAGKIPSDRLDKLSQTTPLVSGLDCSRYGHSSMACTIEAMGLSVEGSSTVDALSSQQFALAISAGKAIVTMAQDNVTPRRILSSQSLVNGIVCDLTCGGSSTTMLNIIAIAKELGIRSINLKTIDDLSRSTPLIFSPQGILPLMQQLHNAGGIYAVIKQLTDAKLFKGDCIRYDNKTLGSLVADKVVSDPQTIRPHGKAVQTSARLRVLRGNVAEDGCICHYSENNSFAGIAKVYNNQESAVDAIMHREIRANDVVVILNAGPTSAIGMPEITLALAMLEGAGLSDKVAVITDGRIPDAYHGIAVGHITPETAEGSILAVLQDGDEIEISVPKGKITCDIRANEIRQRMKNLDSDNKSYTNSYLRNWARNCSTASEGCVVKTRR